MGRDEGNVGSSDVRLPAQESLLAVCGSGRKVLEVCGVLKNSLLDSVRPRSVRLQSMCKQQSDLRGGERWPPGGTSFA
jgi:hypothetical protein